MSSTPNFNPKNFSDWPMVKMHSLDFRHELHTMYNVIVEKNLLDAFKEVPPQQFVGNTTFFISMCPIPTSAYPPHIKEVLDDPRIDALGHSQATQDVALKMMHMIAKHGFLYFREHYQEINTSPMPSIPPTELRGIILKALKNAINENWKVNLEQQQAFLQCDSEKKAADVVEKLKAAKIENKVAFTKEGHKPAVIVENPAAQILKLIGRNEAESLGFRPHLSFTT